VLAVLALAAAVPVTARLDRYEFAQVHMGMPVRIILYADGQATADAAAAEAFARIVALERSFSDYKPDSEVRQLERTLGTWTPVSAELFTVMRRALEVANATGGAFDPSVAPLVALWREARTTGRLPDRAALDAARARVGWQRIELDASRRALRMPRDMRLDLGGIAKGYIVQAALDSLRARGIASALVEAGGDIVVGNAPPGAAGWEIAVAAGDDQFVERASRLTNAALSTSGAAYQFVEIDGTRYSHVIDPRSGLGVTHQEIAHVIADDAATADALATAAGVMGDEGLARLRAAFPRAMVATKSDTTKRRN
jgi:FAD:protein FMN transferase